MSRHGSHGECEVLLSVCVGCAQFACCGSLAKGECGWTLYTVDTHHYELLTHAMLRSKRAAHIHACIDITRASATCQLSFPANTDDQMPLALCLFLPLPVAVLPPSTRWLLFSCASSTNDSTSKPNRGNSRHILLNSCSASCRRTCDRVAQKAATGFRMDSSSGEVSA